jgi:hypothetical protein
VTPHTEAPWSGLPQRQPVVWIHGASICGIKWCTPPTPLPYSQDIQVGAAPHGMRAHCWPEVPFVQWQEGRSVWLLGSWAVKYITNLFRSTPNDAGSLKTIGKSQSVQDSSS